VLDVFERMLMPRTGVERIQRAEEVAAYFGASVALCPVETFWVLMLDARGRAAGHQRVAEGTLTACLVHPREVFGPAIRSRAAQVILVHNHPSGDPTPSDEDAALTERLTEAGRLLGIPVVDHVILARGGHRSIGIPQEGLPWR
jgi:DNA repair protein RadC